MSSPAGPELVIGLVTPIGTNTADLAETIRGTLSDYGYTGIVINLSDCVPADPSPLGEGEDQRVRRLINAGNEFCRIHASAEKPEGDPAALARVAVREIRRARVGLMRQDATTGLWTS
jgi:hypothetical protein